MPTPEQPTFVNKKSRNGSTHRGLRVMEGLPVTGEVDPAATLAAIRELDEITIAGGAPHRAGTRRGSGETSSDHPHKALRRRGTRRTA